MFILNIKASNQAENLELSEDEIDLDEMNRKNFLSNSVNLSSKKTARYEKPKVIATASVKAIKTELNGSSSIFGIETASSDTFHSPQPTHTNRNQVRNILLQKLA